MVHAQCPCLPSLGSQSKCGVEIKTGAECFDRANTVPGGLSGRESGDMVRLVEGWFSLKRRQGGALVSQVGPLH